MGALTDLRCDVLFSCHVLRSKRPLSTLKLMVWAVSAVRTLAANPPDSSSLRMGR